jgi:uncharacterized protein YecE (DUF72 family)
MRLRVGTSGYSYKEWRGTFYPEDLPAADMLTYYAERLPAVEINNTFYRLPKRHVLEAWASRVPEGFRFVLKASRRITHFKLLRNVEGEMEFLLRNLEGLGERLGALLFQLHPRLRRDPERLGRFLELLPARYPAAFELQDPSWHDDAVFRILAERNVALCISDREGSEHPTVSTADWGYVRLRRPDYTEADLDSWARRIREQGWREAFVFVKHEDAGAGPGLAARFAEKVMHG